MRYKHMQDAVPLISERIVLALHESHPLAALDKVSLIRLKHEKFITTGMHSALYNITVQKCLEAGFEPDIAIICDDPYFARKYISLNMGIFFKYLIKIGLVCHCDSIGILSFVDAESV